MRLTQLDPLPATASRFLEVREDDALRVRHASLLDELGVEDLELPGVALPLRVEDEDDSVGVPRDRRPARLEGVVPARVPQLHVGLGEPVVHVQVVRLELEDAHHVRRAVLLRYGVLRRVGDEVGEDGLAGLKIKIRHCRRNY